MKRKVVYNSCHGGGFQLSSVAIKMLYEKKHPDKNIYIYIQTKYNENNIDIFKKIKDPENISKDSKFLLCRKDYGNEVKIPNNITECDFYQDLVYEEDLHYNRHDPDLIQIVESLGPENASGPCAKIEILDIGGSYYKILEEDGLEDVILISSKEEDGECERI